MIRLPCRTVVALIAFLALVNAHGSRAQEITSSGIPAQIVTAFDSIFGGMHKGSRAVHAKGVVALGDFTPSPAAASLSRAVHLNGAAIPIVVRFSNFAGAPDTADGAPEASPRGMAIRFLLADSSTDIVTHSYNGFPAATPADFLEFLHAVAAPATIESFAANRPTARAFLATPKPTPASYGTEAYFGVNAFRFTNVAGLSRFGRYFLLPVAGESHLTPEESAARPNGFLADELAGRLSVAPVEFRLMVQLAEEGDAIADGSIAWPRERPMVELGRLRLRTLAANQSDVQQTLRFNPLNLVGGIAPSSDPMLLARTQAYRVSADRRGAPDE